MRVKLFKTLIFLGILLITVIIIGSIDLSRVNSFPNVSLFKESQNEKIIENLNKEIPNLISIGDLFNYGNWCGVTNTKPPYVRPIDEVDAACKAHDLCIGNNNHKCSCDAIFLRNIAEAKAISLLGENYKQAAMKIIEKKPCYCLEKLPGSEIKLLGFGGKC